MLQCPAPARRHTPCTKHTRDGKHLEGPNTRDAIHQGPSTPDTPSTPTSHGSNTPGTRAPQGYIHQAPQHPRDRIHHAVLSLKDVVEGRAKLKAFGSSPKNTMVSKHLSLDSQKKTKLQKRMPHNLARQEFGYLPRHLTRKI